MSGSPAAFRDMLANMAHGGKVSMLGIPPGGEMSIDWNTVIFNMLTIKGIYGREMYDTWYAMSSMLQTSAVLRDAVRSVITHRFAAADYATAFATVRSGQCGKVILDWSDS